MARIEYDGSNTTVTGTDSSDSIYDYAQLTDTGIQSYVSVSMNIFGLGGSDELQGGDGNDLLFGGDGNDTLFGGKGGDVLYGGAGNDLLSGQAGDDTLQVETGFANFGSDTLVGGDGYDRVSFETAFTSVVNGRIASNTIAEAPQGVSIDLSGHGASAVGTAPDMAGGVPINETGGGVILSNAQGSIQDANGGSQFADIEEFDLTSHTDIFTDSSASHVIRAGAGNDYIEGGGGADLIDGGLGNDTAMYLKSAAGVSVSLLDFGSGGSGSGGDAQGDKLISIENVFGSNFNDFLLGNSGSNVLKGELGNDTLSGAGGADSLAGGQGNDILRGGLGNDALDGGDGIDTALFIDWNGISSSVLSPLHGTITLSDSGAGTAALVQTHFSATSGVTFTTIETDTLTNIENVTGSDISETITGNSAANILDGSGGSDVLDGGRGNDRLIGGAGNDTASYASLGGSSFSHVDASLTTGIVNASQLQFTSSGLVVARETDTLSGIENLTGSAGNDTLSGDANGNVLSGSAGSDVLVGLGGADQLIGGDGVDTADYGASATGVTIDLGLNSAHGGDAEGDTFQSIENLSGSAFADTLSGTFGNNFLDGGAGDDTLHGGAGDDTLTGGFGSDVLDGGGGFNTADYHLESAISIDLQSGTAGGAAAGDSFISIQKFIGGIGGNTMKGDAGDNTFEALTGGNNLLQGRAGDDTLLTGNGNDTLLGGTGIDTLTAGGGDDALNGGADNDTLDGGDGNDTLTGGLDSDTFVFSGLNSGHDQVADYTQGLDFIELQGTVAHSFADLVIAGNGTSDVTVAFGGQSIEFLSSHALTLTADDFSII